MFPPGPLTLSSANTAPASENACVGVIGDVGSVDVVTADTAGGSSAAAKQAMTNGSS